MKKLLLVLLFLLVPAWAWAITGTLVMEAGTVYNLKTALTKGGASVTLTDGTTYVAQIIGQKTIFCADEATAPAVTETAAFRYRGGDPLTERFVFKVTSGSDPYCWLPENFGATPIVVGVKP